jgi:hypothetical protein
LAKALGALRRSAARGGLYAKRENYGYDKHEVLARLALLARTIGRIPALSDMAVARAKDTNFPSPDAIMSNLGNKAERLRNLREYCEIKGTFEDILQLCNAISEPIKRVEESATRTGLDDGFVYLLKSGRYYKIGRTNSVGRREREIALQLPQLAKIIAIGQLTYVGESE